MLRALVTGSLNRVDALPLRPVASVLARLDARLSVRLFLPRDGDNVADPTAWTLTPYGSYQGFLDASIAESRRTITARLEGHGATVAAPSVSFDEALIESWRRLGIEARVYDLAIVSREALEGDAIAAIELLLLDGGVPVLLVPVNWPRPVGERVLIAWNRGTETARLVSRSLPWLSRASEVVVLEIEGWHTDGPPAAAVLPYLAAHGISARLHQVLRGRDEPGSRVLQEARALETDLLLKGAYTQSRLSQIIFGGATRDILADARLPVLFAH